MIQIIHKLIDKYRELILYGIIGATGVIVDVGAFYILNDRMGLWPVLANILSVSIAVIYTFLLNAFFNFKTTDNILKRFKNYYLIGMVGLALSTLIVFVGHDILNNGAFVVKLISVPIVAIIQYYFNVKYSFSPTEKDNG